MVVGTVVLVVLVDVDVEEVVGSVVVVVVEVVGSGVVVVDVVVENVVVAVDVEVCTVVLLTELMFDSSASTNCPSAAVARLVVVLSVVNEFDPGWSATILPWTIPTAAKSVTSQFSWTNIIN